MKIIFLDVDGVLNGYNHITWIIWKLVRFFHLSKIYHKFYDSLDVKRKYVRRVAKICKKTNAKIVLSSSWRGSWYRPYEQKSKRSKTLEDNLKRFHLEVVGITPKHNDGKRGKEITEWLDNHKEVDKFIILDDEKFDMMEFYGKELIITSKDGIIKGCWYENTGIKSKHVKQAIKILNS